MFGVGSVTVISKTRWGKTCCVWWFWQAVPVIPSLYVLPKFNDDKSKPYRCETTLQERDKKNDRNKWGQGGEKQVKG